MHFYLKTWFIVLLVFASVGLFFCVLFLSETATELELISADSAPMQQDILPLGFSKTGPGRGNPQAKIQVAVFADFLCSFCQENFFILGEVLSRHPDDVYLQFRHFPIINQDSQTKAEASMCAWEQNKFWEYYDQEFGGQINLSALNLNQEQFDQCASERKYQKIVEDDFNDGKRLAVSATPTFFINGRKIQGVLPLDVWEKLVAELK
ncbi:MAG: thioredoxin domain-containing protein [Candidatus Jacksonbacteria bacterium]